MSISSRSVAWALCLSMAANTGFSQTGWVLPTEVQSKLEASAPAPKSAWTLPNPLALKTRPSGQQVADPVDRPVQSLFAAGSIAISGFSGTTQRKPVWKPGAPEPVQADLAYRFIDLNGPSVQLLRTDDIGFAMNGAEIPRPAYDKILARDVGQVFGMALDNADFRNLYLTATSAYGLQIVGPDKNDDGVADRLFTGQPGATWMTGQWGTAAGAGPGSVWKVDGASGAITHFANLTEKGQSNQGAGLGNITFDAIHNQLFVSDLQSGLIHRLDMEGTTLDSFAHVPAQNSFEEMSQARLIETSEFDVEDPATWKFAPKQARVWGLVRHGQRLFYGLALGPSVWSVGINSKTGAFEGAPRQEFILPPAHRRGEISDLAVSGNGTLIVAVRASVLGTFDYEQMTRKDRGAVLGYAREKDPQTGEDIWTRDPLFFPQGFARDHKSGAGGVALGPHYDVKGAWDTDYCAASLWSTGQALRADPKLENALKRGGALKVDGVQVQSIALPATQNTPPWKSYFFDADSTYSGETRFGAVGDVEVAGCRSKGGLPEHYSTSSGAGGSNNPPRGGGDCASAPWLCPPPTPAACMTAQAAPVCNAATGEFELRGLALDAKGHGLSHVSMDDPSGTLAGFPQTAVMPGVVQAKLTGLVAGQTAQLDLCAFNLAEKNSGAPHTCCKATVTVTIPNELCKKEGE